MDRLKKHIETLIETEGLNAIITRLNQLDDQRRMRQMAALVLNLGRKEACRPKFRGAK